MIKKGIDHQTLDQTLEAFEGMSEIFQNLADKNRQVILTELGRHDKLNVKQLDQMMQLSRPAISHHLKNLKRAGLIDVEKSGTENYYFLTLKSAITQIRDLMDQIESVCDLL